MRKRLFAITMAGCLCASSLWGCEKDSSKNNRVEIESEEESTEDGAGVDGDDEDDNDDGDVLDDIKTKHSNTEEYVYTDPIYNLDRFHKFTYEVSEDLIYTVGDDFIQVFYDSEFTNSVFLDYDVDYDECTLTISPYSAFSYDGDSCMIDDGSWGSRSKFYIVKYADLLTGEEFDKPEVTVFTVVNDLDAPTLYQNVGTDGYYTLSWTEVEEADFYEVYSYCDGFDVCSLEYTTTDLSASYEFFESYVSYNERFEETFGGTEIDVDAQWTIHDTLELEDGFFVVAKTEDGLFSGMSNECEVSDIANMIPYSVSDSFVREYSGDTILALPVYVDVEMIDESVSQFLINYHNADVVLFTDGEIGIKPSIYNMPIEVPYIYFDGMEYEDIFDEASILIERQEELLSKSVTSNTKFNIPYIPSIDDFFGDGNEPETTEPGTTEPGTTEPGTTQSGEGQTTGQNNGTGSSNYGDFGISDEVRNTIYANSALSEWLALNLLAHNETISLAQFPESANSEYLLDALLEAYNQNPLCGVLDTIDYDYATNSLEVTYILSKQETIDMQEACLDKAKEIVDQIITSGMTDFEKEEVINAYLCENVTYNEDILDYVNPDGTVSDEAAYEFVHSFTPYGVLVENYGVCESYAEGFELLARAAGLEVVIETGRLAGVNHEWNRVKVNGKWCVMDVTNNDNDYMPNTYFNLSEEVANLRLTPATDAILDEYISDYYATTMENEYYVVKGLAVDSDEAVDALLDQLENSTVAIVRINELLDENEALLIAQDVVNEAGIVSASYMYYGGVLLIALE